MSELLQQSHALPALLVAVLASIAAGVMGSIIVVKKISSLTGGLAHAALGGVGLGLWLGFDPWLGAGLFLLGTAVIIFVSWQRLRSSLDTAISLVWSLGMATGVLLAALPSGHGHELGDYLFGSINAVTWADVLWVVLLDVLLLVALALLYDGLAAVSLDEEQARIIGLPVEFLQMALLIMVSLAVLTLIRVVGVILAIALMTLPAAAARPWSLTMGRMMLLAVALAALAASSGLLLSNTLSTELGHPLPPGPLIIVEASVLFALSLGLAEWRKRRRRV